MAIFKLSWHRHNLCFGDHKTLVMGILNVTPDSFSDGGKFYQFEKAITHGKKLVKDGADIIDIGGESTKPFSKPVSAEEEARRVLPVIEKLAQCISVPISIDTTKASVAKKAIKAGASIINDIGALQLDPEMADVAALFKVPVILMHMINTPETMQLSPEYYNVISDIKKYIKSVIDFAVKRGISRSKIIIDPGIGFGKTVRHNLLLIKHLAEFQSFNAPILIGTSRKSFIRNIYCAQNKNTAMLNLNQLIETGTQASIAACVLYGAHIVRVHDVAATCATLKIINAIKNVSSKNYQNNPI